MSAKYTSLAHAPLDAPDVVLDGTWKPCPVCTSGRCTSCEGQDNFTPFDPPRDVEVRPEDIAALLEAVLNGGGEFHVGGCRVEVDKHGPYLLVDRCDPRCHIMSHRFVRWPWRKVLQEATRRRDYYPAAAPDSTPKGWPHAR